MLLVAASLGSLTTKATGAPAPIKDRAGSGNAQKAAGNAVGLFRGNAPGGKMKAKKGQAREIGMRFRVKVAGKATGARAYKPFRAPSSTPTTGTLWNADGKALASASFTKTDVKGWRSIRFAKPVKLEAGKAYTVSVFSPNGRYAATSGGFDNGRRSKYVTAPAGQNGVFHKASSGFPDRTSKSASNFWVDVKFRPGKKTTSPPEPPEPPTTGWPNADNTGVPAGTVLQPYTGPCTITAPRTITGVDATKCDAILIQTAGVVIEKSLLPRVESTRDEANDSVTISDSDVRAGNWSDGALWGYGISAHRVDVTGAQHSFHCNDRCLLTDSWLHDQYNPDGQSYHNNAFISNGGDNMVVRHNTLHCTAILNSNDGGCTANVSLFGDFDPITNVTIDNNLLRANNSSISYCAYGGYSPSKKYPIADHIKFTNNVFERGPNRKCGVYGPVTSFQSSATGNVWSGNVWDDGGVVNPS